MEVPMTLQVVELISIVLAAMIMSMFLGPWLALTRSMATFQPDVFLALVDRLNRNMALIMTVLMPVTLLSMIPVLFFTLVDQPGAFSLTLAAFVLFIVALLVTVLIEVPIIKQIVTWTVATLPDNWQRLRNRWGAFHVVRVVAGIAGLTCLVAGAIFY
jgi:uncharacterized membrane protein